MLKLHGIVLCLVFLANKSFSCPIFFMECGITSYEIETVFQNPDLLLSGNCTFELIVRSDTCGIRIDFEEFSFNQPMKDDNSRLAYSCKDLDQLELSVSGMPNISLPTLCGELSGQHIYLPTKDYDEPSFMSNVTKKLILTVVYFGPEIFIPGILIPSWRIKITQLPCPGVAYANGDENSLGLPSLAPIGCLQYFVNKTGTIESFNYYNGEGHYFGNLNYAICVKRYTDTSKMKLTAEVFQMASNSNSSYGTDRDCDSSDLNSDSVPSKDYLIIPAGVSTNISLTISASKYCGSSLIEFDVNIPAQGPLFIGVVTDAYHNPLLNLEIGFKIKYELIGY